MTKLSVVIPAYKSESMLIELHARIVATLETIADDFEIIIVDDCSQDRTWDAIVELAQHDSRVKGIQLRRNFGQHNALLSGIRVAQHEVIVTMDDDLQHPPEEIPQLLEVLDEGYDVVYGYPQQEQHGLWRTLASKAAKLVLQNIMGVQAARNVSAFRAFNTPVREAFRDYQSPFVSIDVLLSWGTTSFGCVKVKHDSRKQGESHYTFRKLITHTLNMMTGFSVLPLQLASLIGFFFTLFGIGVLIYVIGRFILEGGSVPGFPFLASVIAIFSGAQLFALGIIGEYLARVHFRTMGRPISVVRQTVGEIEDNQEQAS